MIVQSLFGIPSETQTFGFWYNRHSNDRESTVIVIYSKTIKESN